jgi:hypothetical protein
MPVSFGMRNEENERINSVLKQLTALTFVPEDWNEAEIFSQLKKIGLPLETLVNIQSDDLNSYLRNYNFDWANMELFADLLVTFSAKAEYESLKPKAVALYGFIQQESKMFSFEIMSKIAALK